MTPKTQKFDKQSGGKLAKHIEEKWDDLKKGRAFSLDGVVPNTVVAVSCIGPKNAGYNPVEQIDSYRENVRCGMGEAMLLMGKYRMLSTIIMDPCGKAADAVGEVVKLTDWPLHMPPVKDTVGVQFQRNYKSPIDHEKFKDGFIRGEAQNWARELCHLSGDNTQPDVLADVALKKLSPLGIKVEVHTLEWIKKQGMIGFLNIANGSGTEPIFLECCYIGSTETKMHVLMSALGITFESGGLCLRDPASLIHQPGSMAGAAVALATLFGIAQQKLNLNVACVIPIYENMISGCCVRVGELMMMDNKCVKVERTDLGGHVVLADALTYGQKQHKPAIVANVATLTDGVKEATGNGAFACFTNDDKLWSCMEKAGVVTGDRPWRLPIWDYYQAQLIDHQGCLRNQGADHSTTCLGAAFLQKFVTGKWMHMDITGVIRSEPTAVLPPYLNPHLMSGRPVRTIMNFLNNIAQGCEK